MTGPITRHRDIESLKTAARWPDADRNTTVILATRLAAARADAEGYRYFAELAAARPSEALPLTLAGFFQARLGEDADAALAKLDQRKAILLEWAAFSDFLAGRLPVLEQEWKAQREALRAAGELPDDSTTRQGGRRP